MARALRRRRQWDAAARLTAAASGAERADRGWHGPQRAKAAFGSSARAAVCLLLALGCAGCSPLLAETLEPTASEVPGGQPRCRVVASQDRPLVVEWPASDRADLELARGQGIVAVRYSGCEMRVLRDCRLGGEYQYRPTTRELSQDRIVTADELYAKLPLGAISLEGAVSRGATLTLSTTVVGKYVADRSRVSHRELTGAGCAEATHVITGMTVGAFEFASQREAAARGGIDAMGARGEAGREVLRRAGDPEACLRSDEADPKPPANCGALLRVEVEAVDCGPGERWGPTKGCSPVDGAKSPPLRPGLEAALVGGLASALLGDGSRAATAAGWRCEPHAEPAPREARDATSVVGRSKQRAARAASVGSGARARWVAAALLVRLRRPGAFAGRGVELDAFWLVEPGGASRLVVQRRDPAASQGAEPVGPGEPSLKNARGPIGAMTRGLLAALQHGGCDLPLPTAGDLEALGLSPDHRRRAAALLPDLRARCEEARSLVDGYPDGWLLRVERMGALVRRGRDWLTVEAPIGRRDGRLCVGPPSTTMLRTDG